MEICVRTGYPFAKTLTLLISGTPESYPQISLYGHTELARHFETRSALSLR
jgi:hypothetical protein